MDGYDKQHKAQIAKYEKQIEALMKAAIKDAVSIGGKATQKENGKPFSFDDNPQIKKKIKKVIDSLKKEMLVSIKNGIKKEWERANTKNDELVRSVFGNLDILNEQMQRQYLSTNTAALEAFLERQRNGLGLSDRVWNYSDQFQKEIEAGLACGIKEGLSAQRMAYMLMRYLKNPNELYATVRNEFGQNVLIGAFGGVYNPGRGVYRSAFQNARRLAATETNTAYRTADGERYRALDFVVGVRINLSGNHTLNGKPFKDICDTLEGDYPKTFRFTGWHPLCKCYVTSILKTQKEIDEDTQRMLRGEPPKEGSVNEVKNLPPKFRKWIEDNKDRIEAARGNGTEAYFLRDNKEAIDKVLYPEMETKTDKPHEAILKKYTEDVQLNETFKKINAGLKKKWFVNGDLRMYVDHTPGNNGSTSMNGAIYLKSDRLKRVKSAMGKIGSGKSSKITTAEADAMATFWHEITHNRNVTTWIDGYRQPANWPQTDPQTRAMEMMNEFVARKTLPEFYEVLGCAETPHPEFINNRESTGYNPRVKGFECIMETLGLDKDKVLEQAKFNLFSERYCDQENAAILTLLDGGAENFKRADGEPIQESELRNLVKICYSASKYDTPEIVEEMVKKYMIKNGIIPDPEKEKE